MTHECACLVTAASLVVALTACSGAPTPAPEPTPEPAGAVEAPVKAPNSQRVRLATFNAALNRDAAGQLSEELAGDSPQARAIAEIIQRTAPDILVLQEFDHQGDRVGVDLFRTRYLAVSQNGAPPIDYPHVLAPASNTGEPTGLDLDRNGETDGPGDAQGFGRFPGQYAFVVLSRYPIDAEAVRSFRAFKWKDMPGALRPIEPESGQPWYDAAAWDALRLSSKTHVDVPVRVGERTLHVLAAHPTPPVFDGPEDRNGRRNHDEIRLFADYISGEKGQYLVDDAGRAGGLAADATFVIMGDMNADPVDGDSDQRAIAQLLEHPRVHRGAALGEHVPRSDGGRINGKAPEHKGDPGHDTAGWGLRVDYVLPAATLRVLGSGVFWPAPNDPVNRLIDDGSEAPVSSDHRLVWVDVAWGD